MEFFRFLAPALLLCALSLNAENSTESTDWDPGCNELEGSYAYVLSGQIGVTLPPGTAFNESGSIYFDCHGQGHANGVTVLGYTPTTTMPRTLHPEYVFSYKWICPNLAVVSATRSDALGCAKVVFVVGVGEQGNHISLLLLPNATIEATQTAPQNMYNYVQVSGTGGK